MSEYVYGEAFNLMQYRCNRGHSETVWNSRDGVTPFCIPCLQCDAELMHVHWDRDVRAVDHRPQSGERFFRDGTPEEAKAILRSRIEQGRGTEYELSEEEAATILETVSEWSEFHPGWPLIAVQP